MASKRLSKLQRAILESIDRFDTLRGELIKTDVGRRLKRKGMAFDVSFPRSLKNLRNKGLLRDARSWYDPLNKKWHDRYYTITSKGRALLLKHYSGLGFQYLRQMVNSLEEDQVLNVLRELRAG